MRHDSGATLADSSGNVGHECKPTAKVAEAVTSGAYEWLNCQLYKWKKQLGLKKPFINPGRCFKTSENSEPVPV